MARPFITHHYCPCVSPLTMDYDSTETLIYYAERGLPGHPTLVPNAGLTSPLTLAGTLVQGNAEFLAAVQLLLYAGGVVTIAVFAIVVTERLVGDRITQTSRQILTGSILSGALLVALLVVFRRGPLTVPRPTVTGDLTHAIGQSLLTSYVLPFELLGVLLLVALVGALYFARPDD